MGKWIVKKGNTSVQDVLIQDKNGADVTNLADAVHIKFQVKDTKTAATPKIEKTKGDGISVNTPSTGYLRIWLTPTDTDIDVKEYYMALEIKWSNTVLYEVILLADGQETDLFEIEQDIVLT